jgi:RNA polymerase-associated protein CTR9
LSSFGYRTFKTLAEADASVGLPYSPDLAHNRMRFGDIRLKKAPAELEAQRQYEASEQAKMDQAKRERELAEQKKAEAEALRLEEIRIRSEQLAEQRRQMKQDVSSWYVEGAEDEGADAGGDGAAAGGEGKPKKGRKKKKVKTEGDAKSGGDGESDEDQKVATFFFVHKQTLLTDRSPCLLFQPSRRKKRATTPEADGEAGAGSDAEVQRPAKKSRKVFKSKDVITDSDEE